MSIYDGGMSALNDRTLVKRAVIDYTTGNGGGLQGQMFEFSDLDELIQDLRRDIAATERRWASNFDPDELGDNIDAWLIYPIVQRVQISGENENNALARDALEDFIDTALDS